LLFDLLVLLYLIVQLVILGLTFPELGIHLNLKPTQLLGDSVNTLTHFVRESATLGLNLLLKVTDQDTLVLLTNLQRLNFFLKLLSRVQLIILGFQSSGGAWIVELLLANP
jgi:hypothetical protein